jgi:hypothetical protein
LDKFPEAFRRFESTVDIGKFETYYQLSLGFRWWAGQKWRGTPNQWRAFNREAENLGFEAPRFVRDVREALSWKQVRITVRGKSQSRYRDVKTGRFIRKPTQKFSD